MKHFVALSKSDIVSVGAGIDYSRGVRNKEICSMNKSRSVVRASKFRGLPLNIELDTGMTASGKDPDGKPWEVTYKYPYGEIVRTEGEDKDPVDIYLGPNLKSDKVFVVHQTTKEGKFDEDKVFLGFGSSKAATKCYFDHGPKWGFGSLDSMDFKAFKNGYLASNRREGFKKSLIVIEKE